MKEITLSIIQLDTDLKNRNLKGVVKFINNIEAQYESFLKQYKYKDTDPSEFKKEVREVLNYVLNNSELGDMARQVHGTGDKVQMYGMTLEVHLPLVKKIYDIRNKYDFQYSFAYGENPLKSFVQKYQDRYDSNDTAVWAWYYFILHKAHPSFIFTKYQEGWNKKAKEISADKGISFQNFRQTYSRINNPHSTETPSYRIITEVVKLFESEDDPDSLVIAKGYLRKAELNL